MDPAGRTNGTTPESAALDVPGPDVPGPSGVGRDKLVELGVFNTVSAFIKELDGSPWLCRQAPCAGLDFETASSGLGKYGERPDLAVDLAKR
jgi:hypothetical protein